MRKLNTREIRRAYRQEELAYVCTLPEREFGDVFGMETITVQQQPTWGETPEDYYHFRDNDANVLAVAHLDTVMPGHRRIPRFRDTGKGPLIVSGALDDRLGAYVILGLLPKLGVKCDWLFTVGEESGCSTAEFFEPCKNYDWVIEFDRGGTDVVMYQYEDEPCRQAVETAGATVGAGSFSDIAYLEHLGVKAFNWGVGYRGDYHSDRGFAYLNDTFTMVAKYRLFNEQNAGTAMPHDGGDIHGMDEDACWVCGGRVDLDTGYCQSCESCQDCWEREDECLCYTPRRGTTVEGETDAYSA